MPDTSSSAQSAHEQGAVTAAVREMIRGVRQSAPLRAGALTLIPLMPASEREASQTGYLPLEEALRRNLVAITEQPQAQVPGLLAVSMADEPVVLVGGEQVLGGLQNRVLNTTILLAPHVEIQIPVTCVEAGRWHGAPYARQTSEGQQGPDAPVSERPVRSAFTSGQTAYASLRRMHTSAVSASLSSGGGHRSDQGAVWGAVARRLDDTDAESDSYAMEALYNNPDRARMLGETMEALQRPEGAIGFVAVLNGAALGAEIFADEALAQAYWEKMARSYAIEALDTPANSSASAGNGDGGEARLLTDALAADIQIHPSPGLGVDARVVSPSVSGAGLVYEGQTIHLSLFPEDPNSELPQRPRRRTGNISQR